MRARGVEVFDGSSSILGDRHGLKSQLANDRVTIDQGDSLVTKGFHFYWKFFQCDH